MSYTLTLSDEAQRTIDEQLIWYEADEKQFFVTVLQVRHERRRLMFEAEET